MEMSKKSRRKPKLSPVAQKIVDLIDSEAGGSQRRFASMVGCAQPVLSRIVNGRQEPGRDLVERIAKLDGVDRQSLLDCLGERADEDFFEECSIPIAPCLLRSCPPGGSDQLTASTLAVSYSVHRPSLYAVQARMCEPAFSDPSERLRPDDLIVIESSTAQFRSNLMMLNGKLAVVVVNDETGETVTLRRVWVRFDAKRRRRVVCTCSDAKVDNYLEQKFGGKLLRAIELDPPERIPAAEVLTKFVNEEIDIAAIAGMAIQLIRNL